MPQTAEILTAPITNNKETYARFIHFLGLSIPKLNESLSDDLTTKVKNAIQDTLYQTKEMVPITKVRCTCTVVKKDNFDPTVDAVFRIQYHGYPMEFKLSERISVRNTAALSIFREQDWEKIISVLKNDVYAAFYRMTSDMPLFIFPIDSLPSDLKEYYQKKILRIGNVTAVCTKEIIAKFSFFSDRDNCIRMAAWKDNSISIAEDPFMSAEESWKTEIDPKEKGRIFADPLVFLGFCSLASDTLSKSFSNKTVKTKPVFFRFQGGRFYIQAENNKSLDISDLFLSKNKYQKSVQGRLKDLLKRFFSGEICPTKEQSELEIIIKKLSKTELFLLRYCAHNMTQSFFLTHPDFVPGNCECIATAASRLCDTYLTQRGKNLPFLHADNGKYSSDVVCKCPQLHKHPLPRLPLEVLDELGESALKFYFVEKSANPSDAESRWDALCALERLPVDFFCQFLDTKAGTNFFRCFSGNDAIYAKYIIEFLTEE